ncbi:MAG: hypothetical protein U5R48_12380 [Gammaproteobacteria bacterium]|nr:hypothetical protein [Gammaproteobacteria bacterium]
MPERLRAHCGADEAGRGCRTQRAVRNFNVIFYDHQGRRRGRRPAAWNERHSWPADANGIREVPIPALIEVEDG